MKICFIVNKHFAIFFARLARLLEPAGHEVFWISPSRRWSLWLLEEAGVAPDRILTIPDFADEWQQPGEPDYSELDDIEQGWPTVTNVILMCRALRQIPALVALKYLATCRRHIEPFLAQHDIGVCFGEPTWGFEILTWMVSRKLGIPYLHPTTTRIPDDRFAFFDALPHQIVALREVTTNDHQWAEQFYDQWRDKPRRPIFSVTLPKPFAVQSHWWQEMRLALLRPELSKGDLTIWPMRQRLLSRARVARNRATLGVTSVFEQAGNRPFVLLCLHQQPEASIDVFGAFHSDQVHFIERIARLLPLSHELWVKEHIDALGARPVSWLKRIARIPNVRMIDPRLSTFDLMKRAALVVSATGTVSYEAGLLGVPAMTAAPIFFDPVLAIDPRHYPDPLVWPWEELLSSRPDPEESRRRAIGFLAWIHAQSFPGLPFDPVTVANAGRDPENVEMEAAGFLAALTSPALQRRRVPETVTAG